MEELKKNLTYTATVTGYTSTGAGVCRICGRAVFVPLVLMGEEWEVLIVKLTASAVYGKGVRLLRPSPERRSPNCPVFGRCGGCDLLHMSYEEELRFKLSRVNDALERVGGLELRLDEIIPAEEAARRRYRNKAIFNVSNAPDGSAVTGFYRERTHQVIGIEDCQIQTELSVRCAAALREYMDSHSLAAYDETTGRGHIRHLYTRCSLSYPQSVACIVAADGLSKHRGALASHLSDRCPELTGIVLCVNSAPGNSVLGGEYTTLLGSETLTDKLCGLKFCFSPQSFYQINPRQAEKLYQRAVSYACGEGCGTVLDLYCGTGTIGLCAASRAKEVIGVEVVESAVENARKNAEENGIENARFILGDAGAAALSLEKSGIRPEVVMIDPPRKGLSGEVPGIIAAMEPRRVVYVSCDPATLARDLRRFSELGYSPLTGAAVDMFPSCAHVESVVLMSKVR